MNLDTLFDELRAQHFEAALPYPRLAWNSRMSTTAGRFAPGGSFFGREPLIEIASYLRTLPDGHKHIRDTLLHEMIHYYLWWQKKPYGHTPEFYAIMKRTGATRFNPVPKLRPVKYWYECTHCKVSVPARRELGLVACAPCCKRYNGGEFSRRFLLQKRSQAPLDAPTKMREDESPEVFIPGEELVSRLQQLRDLIKGTPRLR